ncbi:unnamed protein product, partial [Rotaria sordida]
MYDEKRNTGLLDLAQGLVFRCHIIHHTPVSSNDLLCDKDAIIFNFHHASFDFPSMHIFLHDLNQAYSTGQLTTDENSLLRYLDYAMIEQQMSMTAANMFWLDILRDHKIDHSLPLPFDRYRLSDEHRTGRGISFSFDFGEDLSHDFLSYSSSHDITAEQLTLASYFAFLFKLTNGESDLCIGMNTNGRYKEELTSVIGMFVNVIPLRCQLDPHWSFHQLTEHVKQIFISSLKYSYFPLQRIVVRHPNATKPAFLETSFEFQSYTSKSSKNQVMIGDVRLAAAPISIKIDADEIMSKFDFILTTQHNLDIDQLSCTINASLDLFDRKTIDIIGQRFHSMLEQLFDTEDAPTNTPIYELSLILSDEKLLMKSMNNTQVLFPSLTCIHHEFVKQAMEHSQKLAVELDDQSLTYCELLYYVQLLSMSLLNTQKVIGVMAIEMAGGVYCPLSPRDPRHRLHALLQQTQSRLVLTHHLTNNKFTDNIFSIDIDAVLTDNLVESDIDFHRTSNILITPDNIAYIIFTSGSTGMPKAVQVRHQNFTKYEFSQSTAIDQQGELLVGGVGVFAGYLGRNDLTTRALIVIDGEIFYRTGDLVRMDHNGLLHYQGRKDHQIKLHGQRIELGEIEQCLLNTSISACVVIKWDDDNLIVYVQSSNINEEQLRQHCQCHLPPYMIPSLFIILDKLPLNANGKIDRKLLPSPSSYFFNHLQRNHTSNLQMKKPHDEIQITLHTLWCDMFQQKQISIDTNIFTIGGHSLLLMQLYRRYQTTFHLETKSLSINDLFQYPTIIDHSQFIRQAINIEKHFEDCWSSLHLIQAPASFAQERIFLDEQIRFSSRTNNVIYTIPLLYRVASVNSHISITRLHHALQFVIMKHSILRTALHIDSNGIIMQYCLNININNNDIKPYGFSIINLHDDKDSNIDKTITEMMNNSDLFDLTKGCVIHCHILRQYHPDDNLSFKNDDLLTKDDLILFNIHHSAFDGASTSIFLRDFSVAYETDCSLPSDDDALQYIDYSIYEHQMDMTLSRNFWQAQLQAYNLEYRLSLSTDRHRSSTHQRSGLASVAKISFDDQISIAFLNYASTHKITPFQLGLAIFYTFLFKLTHGQSDLFITCLNANRYKSELENMIGMFVATLPYRIQLNSHWSFNELVKHVRDRCTAVEQEMPMTAASIFWLETLYDCRLDRSLQLPYDRYRLSDEHRTGRGISFSFEFGEELSRVFLSYSSSNDITLAHIALACYYAFLFKLTNGESDLCIGMNTDGRYKEELMSVIGMFVNAIPLRCQLDPHWSFHQLVEDVRDIARNSLKYSYFPLQRILAQHPNATKPAFLETSFEFRSYTSKNGKNKVMIGNVQLIAAPFSIKIGEDEIMSKFDFILTIQHDLDINQLSCTINASLDLFDRKTVDMIAQRFHSMLEQLFDTEDAPTNKPIYELSLILADEKLLMKSMNNTQVLSPSVTCIHHEFVHQVMKHPQKLAVELDDQSLTYCELLYYTQVIGIMAIEMAGGVYCPLLPRDPRHRLHMLVEQTQSQLVLVHHLTKNKFNDSEVLPVKLAKLMRSMVTSTCRVWNLYGPAEITIDCTSHV